jgi:UDP-glucose 4-epimerase
MSGYAITGGAGFVGQAVQRALADRGLGPAYIYDRASGGDINHLTLAHDLGGASTLIHLAGILGTAELFHTPQAAIDINVSGTLRALQWCEAHGAAYVGLTLPYLFPSVYTATKQAADLLATAWHHGRGLAVSKVQSFNIYGPGQKYGPGHPQKVVPTFSVLGWQGSPLPIWGDGQQTMDLVHVDDVARLLLAATNYGHDETFHAGTGTTVTVNELADFIIGVTGSSGGVKYLPMRPGEVPTRVVASGLGWDLLGWQPVFDWGRVAETVRSYRALAETSAPWAP